MITKEVEIALKQVRSARNLGTKIKKGKHISDILEMHLDQLEDSECGRYTNEDEKRRQEETVRCEIIKLVPENYRVAILPAKFSYTDGERIRRTIADQGQEFMLNSKNTAK